MGLLKLVKTMICKSMLEMFKDIYGDRATFINEGHQLNKAKAQWLLRLRTAFILIPFLVLFFEGLNSLPKIIIFLMPYSAWLAFTYFVNSKTVSDLRVRTYLYIDVFIFLFFCFLFIHQVRHLWLFVFVYSFLSASILRTYHGLILYLFLNTVIYLFQKKYYYIFVNPGTIDPYLPYILNTAVFVLAKSLTKQLEYSNSILNGLKVKSLENDRLRALGSLMSGISHEFGTPINTLKIKIDKYKNNKEKTLNSEDLDVILNSLNKLETTLKKINHSNLKESEKFFEVINLQTFFTDLFDVWSEDKRNVLVDKSIHDNVSIRINIVNFTQVIFNLFDNAFEAVDSNTELKIKISTHINNNSIELNVEDNGVGIEEKIINRVGDPFFTTKEKGTGLGIYSSILFINSCGGSIKLKNTGHGLIVSMNLPLSMLAEVDDE